MFGCVHRPETLHTLVGPRVDIDHVVVHDFGLDAVGFNDMGFCDRDGAGHGDGVRFRERVAGVILSGVGK